jgi:hypothetical protein
MQVFLSVILGLLLIVPLVAAGLVAAGIVLLVLSWLVDTSTRLLAGPSRDR